MTIPNTATRTTLEQLQQNLNSWISESPDQIQANAREEAAKRITRCFRNGSRDLDLSKLRLTSIPSSIGSLEHLQKLNLGRNRLTQIPAEIGKLRELRYLYLSRNRITQIPAEIGNLMKLQVLYFDRNRLTQIPDELGNLNQLQFLHFSDNRLTQIPAEIANLEQMQELYLDRNQLNTIPNILLTRQRENPQLIRIPTENIGIGWLRRLLLGANQILASIQSTQLIINLGENPIALDELQRIYHLSSRNNIRLRFSFYQTIAPDNTNIDVKNSILALSRNREERLAIEEFLSLENFEVFDRFLSQCSRTGMWTKNPENSIPRERMSKSLYELINKMREDEALAAKCLAIASDAFGTCGDRVSLSYAQMMAQKDIPQKPINEMNEQELIESAKKESIFKFLNEKADARINELTERGVTLDEIETHLAYLQAAPQFGLDLPAIDMLFRKCSNVSDEDIKNSVIEFGDLNKRAAMHAYEDSSFKEHPEIKKIITEVLDDSDTSINPGESESDFMKRIKEEWERLSSIIIQRIAESFAAWSFALNNKKTTYQEDEKGEEEKKENELLDTERHRVTDDSLANRNEVMATNQNRFHFLDQR